MSITNMTNEQRKAMDRLNKDKNKPLACGDITIVNIADLDTVLSLIKEQQEEIEKYEKIYKEYDCYRWVKELNKKDKQIDLMAEYIEKVTVDLKVAFGENMLWNRNEIKQYFADLVEKE